MRSWAALSQSLLSITAEVHLHRDRGGRRGVRRVWQPPEEPRGPERQGGQMSRAGVGQVKQMNRIQKVRASRLQIFVKESGIIWLAFQRSYSQNSV